MEIMESGGELIRGKGERIYVSVRLRPLNEKEILSNDVSDWECINNDTIVFKNVSLLASERSMYPTAYTFDRVFGSNCSTREVYEQGAKAVATSVVHGMNSTVFAYGQTSSGKTYTMAGITEYAIADIYDYMQKHPERDFILKFSAMEIYNESIRDLLSAVSSPLRLLDDPERGTIVEKLTEEILRDRNHLTQLLSICAAQRQIGETSFNEMSSRSHQIIRLTIESTSREFLGRDNASTLAAAVNFVDLAGSERASQSLSAGKRLKEGCHINRSLLTLGTVIRKLSKERNGHIPYRDSKLTRILQSSLGGNARTAIICTMSPACSHVEQSRNTLLFANCAKEVTTNAQVNEVMSDKALVKHLQKELTRLESGMRSTQPYYAPLNYYAILRERDAQIEKLEKEIKDLILQRDIAQSQVKELLRMLGDDASSIRQVGLGNYPHLRVQRSPDPEIQDQENSILAYPNSDVASSDGYSRRSSGYHCVKVPYFDENFVQSNPYLRIVISSNSSESGWEEIEKQSNATLEDLCREIRCVETEELGNRVVIESNWSSFEDNAGFAALKVHVSRDQQDIELASLPLVRDQRDMESASPPLVGDQQDIESASTPLVKDQDFMLSCLKDDNEVKEDTASGILPSKEVQEVEDKEPISATFKKKREFSFAHYLDVASLESLSVTHHLAKDSFGSRSLNLTRSKSCKASIASNSASPWFKMMEYSDNTPSVGSEKEFEGCGRKLYTISIKDFQSPPENALDIEVDTPPTVKVSTDENGISSTPDLREKAELPTEQEITMKPIGEIASKENESLKMNVKDVGLDPIEDEFKGLTSWPVEFKRLQREILELWHACNISLVHRTYFFLVFQGDPTDAIYLQVEIKRMKFLKDKFSQGDKAIMNGQRVTLSSSAKALRQERRMLSEQMLKKYTEQERESFFLEWGIALNSKWRRLQLADLLWTKTEDINHVSRSALLVAKLVGLIERGQTPSKEMFGLNFIDRCSSRIGSFKRSLVSLL